MSEASVVAGGVDCRDLLGPGGGPEPGDSVCLGAQDCSKYGLLRDKSCYIHLHVLCVEENSNTNKIST